MPLDNRTSSRTRQQRDVHRVLLEAQDFVSAQTLCLTLRSAGTDIGLATVYRALHAFVASGDAESIQSATGTQLFRASANDGRLYRLVCQDCQRRVPIQLTFVEDWATSVAAEHGFSDVHLIVEIVGRCKACTPSTTGRLQPHAVRPAVGCSVP